jgi:membrane protease YdiL (CAAX protease family)
MSAQEGEGVEGNEQQIRRRTWKGRIAALLEIFLALGLITDYLALLLLSRISFLSDPLSSVKALAAFTTLSSLLLLVLLALLQRLRSEPILSGYLGASFRWGREAALGSAWMPAIFVFSYLFKSFAHHFAPGIFSGERNVLEELMRGPGDLLLFLFVAIFTGGIKEEFQRAFVIRRFEVGWGPAWLGALLFAVYFGLGHRAQGWDEAWIAGFVGLAWGLLFIRRRSVVAPMASHALFDAAELTRYFLFGPMGYL